MPSSVNNQLLSTSMASSMEQSFVSADETAPSLPLDVGEPEHSYWHYFRRNRAEQSAECRICRRTVKMGNKASTGGMMRHMKFVHAEVFEKFSAERDKIKLRKRKQIMAKNSEKKKMRTKMVEVEGQEETRKDNGEMGDGNNLLEWTEEQPMMMIGGGEAILQETKTEFGWENNGQGQATTDTMTCSINSLEGTLYCSLDVLKQLLSTDEIGTANQYSEKNDTKNDGEKIMKKKKGGNEKKKKNNGELGNKTLTDAELIDRLAVARARLKETMDDIDLLSAELVRRQQSRYHH